MIGSIARVALPVSLRKPVLALAEAPAPAVEPRATRTAPNFAAGISGEQRLWQAAELAFAQSDAFMEAHLPLGDPAQRSLLLGLGRWQALHNLGGVRSDWKHLSATAQARDRWVDEWKGPKALTDPSALPGQGATKAVGLLRMLDAYLGGGVMAGTVARFLQHPSSDFRDFYEQLRSASGEPLPSWSQFSAWVSQTGLPMLQSRVEGHRLTLEQSGFSLYPSEDLGNRSDRWPLPLVIRFRDDEGIKTQRVLLGADQSEVKLKAQGRIRWADPNGSGMGWFRTHFPDGERQALTRDLPKLDLAQQTNFQINQWRQVRHGSEPIGKFYDSLLATKIHDPEWLDLLLYEMGAQRNWARPADRPAFQQFLADLARPAVANLGLTFDPKDGDGVAYQKATFRSWLAGVGDPEALRAAQGVADHHASTGEIPVGLEAAASPELLARLVARAGQGLVDGKIPPEVWPLIAWPGPEGGDALGKLLLDPDCKLTEGQKAQLWKSMAHSSPALDTVWRYLTDSNSSIPQPEKLAESFAVGPYRSKIEELPPALQDKIRSMRGAAETMADISDQIHDFLLQRGYLKAPPPDPEGWLFS